MAESASFLGSVRRFFRDYLLVMETRGSFGQLVQKATGDPALRQRLVQTPKQVLAEAGITLPADLEVEIVENTDKVIHLVLPPLMEASDAEGGTK
ncbi:MAG: NHLP leader peptide family natural product precursor [Deltaproteobacteria bacterium]|nr:NHLP leader peptide family natural product precursor [Deltaproteobacteria bacterium]